MTDASFTRVRAEVARDLASVTPLRPPSVAALAAIPLTLFLASIVLMGYGLRGDAASLGVVAVWAPTIGVVVAAYLVLALALRERVPGTGGSALGWVTLPVAALVIQIGGAHYTFRQMTDPALSSSGPAVCFWHVSLLAVPPVLVVLWLLSRGLTTRPRVAGALGGLAGGFLSEGIYRLHCGFSQPSHIVLWHAGAVVLIGVLGLLAGHFCERRGIDTRLRASG